MFIPALLEVQVSSTGDASGATGELVPLTRPIQIRDLLTHTAGFANNYLGNVSAYRAVMNESRPTDNAELVARLATLPLNYQPGEQWQYSVATDVVGHLVEVISGMTLDVFFAERIFGPLGMPDTHFYLDEAQARRLTAQYTPAEDDQTITLQDPGSAASRWVSGPKTLFRGAGGLVRRRGIICVSSR